MTDLSVGSLNPPQEQLNNLLEHYQSGRLDDAEKLATLITQKYPSDPFFLESAWCCSQADW